MNTELANESMKRKRGQYRMYFDDDAVKVPKTTKWRWKRSLQSNKEDLYLGNISN